MNYLPTDLHCVAAAIEAGAELSAQERETAAQVLRTLLAGVTRRGQRSASTRAAQAERDRLICRMAAEFFPGLPAVTQAEEISRRLARYRAGPDWRRDRSAARVAYAATTRGWCWSVLRLQDRPLSADRIRKILGASSPIS
ncbi:hypothetical protein ABIE79_003325 [Bradyrhizobium diazoefficiens]